MGLKCAKRGIDQISNQLGKTSSQSPSLILDCLDKRQGKSYTEKNQILTLIRMRL